mmetsp:Transcript_71962/g.203211  ORF Transcript_71962/g.203211 Transcript_71962/m.203211 type:complete len:381 (+) Transcript_71962:472-1614(+)
MHLQVVRAGAHCVEALLRDPQVAVGAEAREEKLLDQVALRQEPREDPLYVARRRGLAHLLGRLPAPKPLRGAGVAPGRVHGLQQRQLRASRRLVVDGARREAQQRHRQGRKVPAGAAPRTLEAAVAGVAAVRGLPLVAEVSGQGLPTADELAGRVGAQQHLVDQPHVALAVGVLRRESRQPLHVRGAEHEDAVGGLAVAPRPAALLVVVLHRLGHRVVHDEADVVLVDAHPERDRGDYDLLPARHPGEVGPLAVRLQPLRVVRDGPHPALHEPVDDVVHVPAAEAVYQPRLALVPLEAELGEPGQLVVLLVGLERHRVEEVRAVVVPAQEEAAAHAQLQLHVPLHRLRGRRGEREDRHRGKVLAQDLQLQVVGAELVAPL